MSLTPTSSIHRGTQGGQQLPKQVAALRFDDVLKAAIAEPISVAWRFVPGLATI